METILNTGGSKHLLFKKKILKWKHIDFHRCLLEWFLQVLRNGLLQLVSTILSKFLVRDLNSCGNLRDYSPTLQRY